MNRRTRKATALILAFACVFTMLMPQSAFAAKKTTYVTREYALKSIEKKIGAKVTSAGAIAAVTDVKKGDSSYKTMSIALNAGLVSPDRNGKLNPQKKATYRYVASVLSKITEAEKEVVLGEHKPSGRLTKNALKKFLKEQLPNVVSESTARVGSGNVIINKPVTLKNRTIKGDLIIGDGVGTGEVTLNNVKVNGKLIVRGGGENSIILKGKSLVKQIIAHQVYNRVSIKVQGKASVGTVTIASGSKDVEIQGAVQNVTVQKQVSDISVYLTSAAVDNVSVRGTNVNLVVSSKTVVTTATISKSAEGSKIVVEKDTVITTVVLNAQSSEVSGEGKVTSVQVNANGTKVTVSGAEITVKEGVTPPETDQDDKSEDTDDENDQDSQGKDSSGGNDQADQTSENQDSQTNQNNDDTSSDSQSSDSDDNKPSEDDNKPSEDDSKPSEDDSKPSEDDSKPSEDDNKPSEDDNKPSENDDKPSKIVGKAARTSVHDPSIVDAGNGYYYVFGSHMGVSKTKDLCNWETVTSESLDSKLFGTIGADGSVQVTPYTEAFRKNAYTGKVKAHNANGEVTDTDFGSYDLADWISTNSVQGNMWAPDVIYNKAMGKWCMYLSLNGAKWNSAVLLLTSDDIEGPYVYQGPVVFTGFDKKGTSKDYSKTDLSLAIGDTDELPERYQQLSTDGKWGDVWPHAIDPAVFYDESGNLTLVYGSWSGGIYELQLDEATGLRDYTVQYGSDYDTKGSAVTVDPYFGKKIAGGCYVSGEGPYIKHIGNYYYLFISYGFYSPEGGYNMRVFRSTSPDGPFVDEDGKSAVYDKYVMNYDGTENRGEKLMAGYQWPSMTKGEISQGHNSVLTTSGGGIFVVYHTKFNDGTAGHEVRVHELFVNEDGWLVASPYEYRGEPLSKTGYSIDEVTGDYYLIVDGFKTDYAKLEIQKSKTITLNADGTVSGAFEGTWTAKSGSDYVDITLGDKTYKGVFTKGAIDDSDEEVICFTATASDGTSIWGSHGLTDEDTVKRDIESGEISVPSITSEDLELVTRGPYGSDISYKSSDQSVLSDDGKIVKAVTADTEVILTATVTKGSYSDTKEFKVTVVPPQNDKDSIVVGRYFTGEEVDLSQHADGSLAVPNPLYKGNYNGLNISGGVTIEFDVKRTGDVNVLGTLFAFKGNGGGKLYFTPGSYLGFNNGKYYDANLKDYKLVTDYIGAGGHVSVNLNQDGFVVKVDGETCYTQEILKTDAGKGDLKDYTQVYKTLTEEADTLYFGSGSWWTDAANDIISNVVITVGHTEELHGRIRKRTDAIDHIGTLQSDTVFWTDWTEGYELKNGETKTIKLTNYSDGANNWDNFVIGFVNGPTEAHKLPRNQVSDYLEYAVIRADAFGWGDSSYDGKFTYSWSDWAAWLAMMQDSDVTIRITRKAGVITIDYVFTGDDGSEWTEQAVIKSTMKAASPVYFFFSNEKCYNEILSVESELGEPEEDPKEPEIPEDDSNSGYTVKTVESETVGKADKTSGWWGDWSKAYELKDKEIVTARIHNESNMAIVYHALAAVFANVETPGHKDPTKTSGYSEYMVLRADNYGWGPQYENHDHKFVSEKWNEDTAWSQAMKNADIKVRVKRNGSVIRLTYDVTGDDGSTFSRTAVVVSDIPSTDPLYVFWTVDNCYLQIEPGELNVEDSDDDDQTVSDGTSSTTDPSGDTGSDAGDGTSDTDQETISGSAFTVKTVEKETVGSTETAFKGDWSKGYEIKDHEILKAKIHNASAGESNWQNLIAVFCNVQTTDETGKSPESVQGYSDYAFVRPDRWAWQGEINSATAGQTLFTFDTSWTDWDAWKKAIRDSDINVTITRDGDKLVCSYEFTGTDGVNYTQTCTMALGLTAEKPVYCFFTMEKCRLDIEPAAI